MNKISARQYEIALDKERDKFFEAMDKIRIEAEQVMVDGGIPLETFDKIWERFTSGLDESLIENFSLDPEPEDIG